MVVIMGAEASASLKLEEVCLLEVQVKRPRCRWLHEVRLIEGGEACRDHPVSEYFTAWRRQTAQNREKDHF